MDMFFPYGYSLDMKIKDKRSPGDWKGIWGMPVRDGVHSDQTAGRSVCMDEIILRSGRIV